MSRQIYINGQMVSQEKAVVSVFDHGLLYGDGVFEGLRSYDGQVFRLQAHVNRLWESAQAICLKIPMTQKEMCEAVCATLRSNQIEDGYVRAIVTRGVGTLGLDPNKCSQPQVIIIADTIELYPQEFYQQGLEIVTSSVSRIPPTALNPRIKSLNYLNNILAKIEGLQSGCIEALMLNHKGELAECTGDNIFLIQGGKLLTPPLDAGILDGITRQAVIELAREHNIEVLEMSLTQHDVYIAQECFLTGTAAEVIAVVKVDNRQIGTGKPGPITVDLQERFHALTRV
jgi:branched-chain amino acid aminotransferase